MPGHDTTEHQPVADSEGSGRIRLRLFAAAVAIGAGVAALILAIVLVRGVPGISETTRLRATPEARRGLQSGHSRRPVVTREVVLAAINRDRDGARCVGVTA